MKITTTETTSAGRNYVPLPLGNGDLSLQLDFQGSMEQTEYSGMTPGILRAGVRYDSPGFPLAPFGFLSILPEGAANPVRWSQTLDTDRALVSSTVEYPDGSTLQTESFCCLTRNIAVFRRRFSGPGRLRLEYRWQPRRTRLEGTPEHGLHYRIDGLGGDHGSIHLFADRPVRRSETPGSWQLTAETDELCFFLAFGDGEAAYARRHGFDGLFAEHCAAWREFHSEGFAELPPSRIREVYETAIYHLRISSTRWSIPVGLFPGHWEGRYFGFDEFFAVGGLLTAGRLNTARRVPEFRRAHLDAARQRTSGYFGKDNGSARFPWETVEQPGLDGAPPGLWSDHIFHMATIAQTAWEHYQYTGDREYLAATGYPVIRGCAEFFRIQAVTRAGGRATITKCCDLERLGAARENPFLTTCGAIAAFDAAAQSAGLLEQDAELAAEWLRLAGELRDGLPRSADGVYLPYPGCTETSIAVLGGLFPFPVLPPDDPVLRRTVERYFGAGPAAGNMYPIGHAVCTWYAAWQAMARIRLGQPEEALKLLEQTAESTGCFSEIFEIYETGNHPWFTTAEGLFVRAVNELLTSSPPAAWRNVRFRLPRKREVDSCAMSLQPSL